MVSLRAMACCATTSIAAPDVSEKEANADCEITGSIGTVESTAASEPRNDASEKYAESLISSIESQSVGKLEACLVCS
jgi:hypothetical protein